MGERIILKEGFIRENISPRVTEFYKRLGYVNRNSLASGLHQINSNTPQAVIDLLKEQGILKQRFAPTSTQEIKPYMLKTVSSSSVDAIFKGSESSLINIASGVEAGYDTVISGLLAEGTGPRPLIRAFFSGTLTAAAIGAVILGAPAIAYASAGIPGALSANLVSAGSVSGAAVVYGIISTLLMDKIKDPHSVAAKICKVGTRVLPFAMAGVFLNVLSGTFHAGGMVTDFLKDSFQWIMLTGVGITAGISGVEIKRAFFSRKSDKHMPSKGEIVTTVSLSNFRTLTGLAYINYRTILPFVFAANVAIGFVAGASPVIVALTGCALLWRAALLTRKNAAWLERKTESIAENLTKGLSKVTGGKISGPLPELIIEGIAVTTIRYGMLAGLMIGSASNPLTMFFGLATIYSSFWTLFADVHSTMHSIGTAIVNKTAMFHVEDSHISDAARHNLKAKFSRLCAHITELDRTVSKIANALIQDSPDGEINYCGELGPKNDFEALTQTRKAKKVLEQLKDMTDDIYDRFHIVYEGLPDDSASQDDVYQAAYRLAGVFAELGNKYFPDKNNTRGSYIGQIRNLIATDGKLYDTKGEEPYLRQVFDSVKLRGDEFLEMAAMLRKQASSGYVTADDLRELNKEMLGIFSVTINHFLRKLQEGDDNFATKGENTGRIHTHLGDTLYEVFTIENTGSVPLFKPEFIPAKWVRINNPKYNHLNGNNIENKKYIWIRRKAFLKMLGISQSIADDLMLVDNSPSAEIEAEADKHPIKNLTVAGQLLGPVSAFYSNETILKPKKLIKWNGSSIDLSDTSDLIWVAGGIKPLGFKKAFEKWANHQYRKEKILYKEWKKKTEDEEGKKDVLWVTDKPEIIVFAPAEYYNISDENYVVRKTESVLIADIENEKARHKVLRVPNYEKYTAEYPNPGFAEGRKVSEVRAWGVCDALIGLRYEVEKDGKTYEYNVPYDENRSNFINADEKNFKFEEAYYGLIRKDGEHQVIDVYGKPNAEGYSPLLGEIQTPWPKHIHPAKQIKGKKIWFDVFPNRMGKMTWVEAIYDNYGSELWNSHRFAPLDPDTQAKQQFHPNFIDPDSVITKNGGKTIEFTTSSINVSTYPIDNKWLGIERAKDVKKVTAIDTTGDAYVDGNAHTWSPKPGNGRKAENGIVLIRDEENGKAENGIVLIRDEENGKEYVVALKKKLPGLLSVPENAIRVIGVERGEKEGELVFIQLQEQNKTIDKAGYTYYVGKHLYDNPKPGAENPYQELFWMLKENEFTVRVKESGEGKSKTYSACIYNEKGERVKSRIDPTRNIEVKLEDLKDIDGMGFLGEKRYGMGSIEDFYQSSEKDEDNIYKETREYRPRLYLNGGEICLEFTRVKRTPPVNDASVENLIKELGIKKPKMFFSKPTCAVQTETKDGVKKWVPLSLPVPIYNAKVLKENRATVTANVKGKTVHFRIPVSKDLPEYTYQIRYEADEKRFYAYTAKFNENCIRKYVKGKMVNIEVEKAIRKELKAHGIHKYDGVVMTIFHTSDSDVIDGEWQSRVGAQVQHGAQYLDEAYPASLLTEFRDRFFYGIINQLCSAAFPPNGKHGFRNIQSGSGNDFDRNGMYCGKPIENGTQFMGQYAHLGELIEVMLGLPRGGILAAATDIDRSGGFEKVPHKEHFTKLMFYCREKGWLAGVSEDEQGVLALFLALGYNLKYGQEVTAFESQPTSLAQGNGQEHRRYNTTESLAHDVLMPYEEREAWTWLLGKEMSGTLYKKFTHLRFATWYKWPKAELTRQVAPAIFMFSGGNITPYIVDPLFLQLYILDFIVSVVMYTRIRMNLGYTKKMTGHNALYWSLIQGPAMNLSLLFSAIQGQVEQRRKGWQYGQFIVTSQENKVRVQPENKVLSNGLIIAQVGATAVALAGNISMGLLLGAGILSGGYLLNEFWAALGSVVNLKAKKYIEECDIGNPQNIKKFEEKNPDIKIWGAAGAETLLKRVKQSPAKSPTRAKEIKEVEFHLRRLKAMEARNKIFEAAGFKYKDIRYARILKKLNKKSYQATVNMLKTMVKLARTDPQFVDPNMVIKARELLERLGEKVD